MSLEGRAAAAAAAAAAATVCYMSVYNYCPILFGIFEYLGKITKFLLVNCGIDIIMMQERTHKDRDNGGIVNSH